MMNLINSVVKVYLLSFLFFLIAIGASPCLAQEKTAKLDRDAKKAREQSLTILGEMKEILKEHYYDPRMRGIDLDARIEAAKERVKTMQYNWQMFRVLVQVLMDFDDSHTVMHLPARADHFQYGFGLQMIGNECFITSVEEGSDAQKQGLEVGDKVKMLGKFQPNRRDLWKMLYVLYKLDPYDTLDVKIHKPNGEEKSLTVKAKTMTEKEFRAKLKSLKSKTEPYKCREVNKELIACKLESFMVEKDTIDKMMKEVAKYPKFLLDLRGNGGGYVVTEQYLLSHFFDREVKIADLVTRKKSETRWTKPVGNKLYKGEVVVLVDSNSASAAEMTARVLQIEKRAKIIGDYTSGKVMTSITLPFTNLIGPLADYAIIKVGMSVTVADVIMSDGSKLEKAGVVPDEILQPTGSALAKNLDPVLSYAAQKLGADLTPEKAGEFHFLGAKTEGADTDEDNN